MLDQCMHRIHIPIMITYMELTFHLLHVCTYVVCVANSCFHWVLLIKSSNGIQMVFNYGVQELIRIHKSWSFTCHLILLNVPFEDFGWHDITLWRIALPLPLDMKFTIFSLIINASYVISFPKSLLSSKEKTSTIIPCQKIECCINKWITQDTRKEIYYLCWA